MQLTIGRLLACFVLVATGTIYGVIAGHLQLFPNSQVRSVWRRMHAQGGQFADSQSYGRWHRLNREKSGESLADEPMLENIGYAGAYEDAPEGEHGVLLSGEDVQPGLTLFCSGHAPVVLLIDSIGETIHSWRIGFEQAFAGKLQSGLRQQHKQFIRRARVFPNGDILALFEYSGIVKLDKDSNVIWSLLSGQHHDFQILEDGGLLVLTDDLVDQEQVALQFPGLPAGSYLRDNSIVHLGANGEEIERTSILRAFQRSEFAQFAFGFLDHPKHDPIHANSVVLIDSAEKCWDDRIQVGDLLVSSRNMNALFVIRPREGRVVWLGTGRWRGQHQASVLQNGNILLLDNLGGNLTQPFLLDRSRVVEWDPRRDSIAWSYSGSEELPLFTHWLGYVQALDNGNVLITESSQGRLLEVTRDGKLVWQYLSPYRAGEDGELIATLMGAQRIAHSSLSFLSD